MASTYSNLKIELIADGEQVSVWGATTNQNLEAIESAIGGYATVDFPTDANKTLAYADSNAAQPFRSLYFNITSTGTLTAVRTLFLPAVQKMYIVKNATTGGQAVTINIAGGSGVNIPNGETYIVYADGTNVVYAAPGLFYFDETFNDSAPNATVPAEALVAGGVATNIDVAIVPKGTGAFLTATPDNTAAGGNKRGASAVDLQIARAAATDIAAAERSTIGGGSDNSIDSSATHAVISGGSGNQTLAVNSVTGGGADNTTNATATAGVVGGGSANILRGAYSAIGGGRENQTAASATYSSVPAGYKASATNYGQEVIASGAFSSALGTAQRSRYILRTSTTSDAASRLTSDGVGSANADNTVNMPAESLFVVTGIVSAKDTNTSVADAKAWEFTATFKRGALASSVELVGTAAVSTIAADTSAAAWALDITADIVNGGISFSVSGAPGTTIRWVASVDTTENVNG
jgi:hypothetical protein